MANGKQLISRKAIYQQQATCGAETPAALVPGLRHGANGISRGKHGCEHSHQQQDIPYLGMGLTHLWLSGTRMAGLPSWMWKRMGAAVPILTPNYLPGKMEVRLDHILHVWHLGQQLLSLLNWKISRNVLERFVPL